MNTVINLKDFNGNSNTKNIQYMISGSSVNFYIPDISEDTLIYAFVRNMSGDYTEYAGALGGNIRVDNLSAGKNSILLKAQNKSGFIWISDEIEISTDKIEVKYHFTPERTLLKWNSVNGADGYMIYTKTENGIFTSIKEVNNTEAVLWAIPTEAELKIKPFIMQDGTRNYIKPYLKFTVTEEQNKDILELKAIYNTKKSAAEILWNKINGADNYKIFYKSSDKEQVFNVKDINYLKIQYLASGLMRFYIKAFKQNKCIAISPIYCCKIEDIELFAINKDYKIYLYWNKISGADRYRLFKKNDNGEFEGFLSVQKEAAVIENAIPGEIYEFKVKPYKMENGQRIYSTLSAKCKLKTFKKPFIQLTINEAFDNKIALSWLFEGDVDGFQIFKDGKEYLRIEDGLAHIELVEYSTSDFQIRGYKRLFNDTVYTCESEVENIRSCRTSRIRVTTPETYKLSIVIPAYNAKDFISRCISTVLASNLDDLEIIIVDDGSKDNTKDILAWYRNKYQDFVRVFFKENGGAADARNYGIKHAQGEYIAFVDSDDMIRPSAYSKMVSALDLTKTDIVISRLYKIDNDRYWIRHTLPLPVNETVEPEEYMRLIFTESYNNVAVWNKMYKTRLVKEHPIPLISYEDAAWTPYILSWAEKLCYIDEICTEWDRKIRKFTLSNELSNRDVELKFKERHQAVKFFYENGNPKRKEVLAYLFAKRMYNQGESAKYNAYFETINDLRNELLNNKFLLEDKDYYSKIYPIINKN